VSRRRVSDRYAAPLLLRKRTPPFLQLIAALPLQSASASASATRNAQAQRATRNALRATRNALRATRNAQALRRGGGGYCPLLRRAGEGGKAVGASEVYTASPCDAGVGRLGKGVGSFGAGEIIKQVTIT
jgi:hypothetical protein